ncbi:flippase [Leptolyngbya sp. BL0902]|uniref:flippase n=1 Tax=Leptolyngbya sp. BL0902 TaxID=1115757 RepID=UPI0018E90947|nr:flippase [Leptolyngbya sp. BL0902]QQE65695.1 flippase [Leptolyngbya sp. BL0902]
MRRKIIKKISGTGLIGIAQKAGQLLVSAILARSLGAEDYGVYAYALSVIVILSLPINAGIQQVVIRETATFELNHDWGLLKGLLQWSISVVLGISILVISLSVGIVLFFINDNSGILDPKTFMIAILALPIDSLSLIRTALMRGLRHPVSAFLPEGIVLPWINIALILWLLLHERSLSPPHAMSARLLSSMISGFLGFILVLKVIPKEVFSSHVNYHIKGWLSAIVPFTLFYGINLINTQADIIMLGFFRRPEEVGLYQSCIQLILPLSGIMLTINSVISPYISRFYEQENRAELAKISTLGARVSLFIFMPFCLIYIFKGQFILRNLYGDIFAQAAPALMILSGATLVNVAFGPVATILNMTRNENESLKGILLSAFFNLLANLIVIPRYGIIGAAITTLISYLIWNIFLWIRLRAKLGLDSSIVGFHSL